MGLRGGCYQGVVIRELLSLGKLIMGLLIKDVNYHGVVDGTSPWGLLSWGCYQGVVILGEINHGIVDIP